MAKIIKVDAGVVTIAKNSGDLIEVPDHSLSFIPEVNDVVEVYENQGEYIINQSQATVVNNIYTGGKLVNKLAYSLLALFLGGLGIHKFYAGKTGMGIVYLLFCWTFIPSAIAFIEGLVGLTKQEVEPGMIIV